MLNPLPMFFLALADTAGTGAAEHAPFVLLVVFAFVLGIVAIGAYFRNQRLKMWHETARLALEKGQPLPEHFEMSLLRGFRSWGGGWWELRRGILLLAISIGFWFSSPERSGWVAITASLGGAFILIGLISMLRRGKASQPGRDSGDPLMKL